MVHGIIFMCMFTTDTKITFPGGGLSAVSTILLIREFQDRKDQWLIITETTPFHPVDFNWPDQPSDRGTLTFDNRTFAVDETLVAAFHIQTQEFLLDQEIKAKKIRRGDPGWIFLVAHIISGTNLNDVKYAGKSAILSVDPVYRNQLSQSHTACHLSALALNKVSANFWKKTPKIIDSLGNPSLDAAAIVQSKITVNSSIDKYRCGKSLRREGFDDAKFFTEFNNIEAALNSQLDKWCKQHLQITVTPAESLLSELRFWNCFFSNKQNAKIPCGGTHITEIKPPNKIIVSLQLAAAGEFTMISQFMEE